MPEYKTPPINTSTALVRDDDRATTYFKHWLDVIWRRTGGFTDISATVADLQAVEYVVGASAAITDNERVGTNTGRIAWDFATAGQAKLDLIAGSVTYTYLQDVSATDKILGRASPGAGDIEEIDCTAAGRALLDDANAAAQLTTLGVSAFIQTLLDDANAAAARSTLGAMDATTTLDAIPVAVASVNFNGQQATNFRVENRTSDPASPSVGQIWLRVDL